jgi:hypothetical protein
MSIRPNPTEIPSMWGMLRRTPKFIPDASSIRLFGPGVIEVTKAKTMRLRNRSIVMT